MFSGEIVRGPYKMSRWKDSSRELELSGNECVVIYDKGRREALGPGQAPTSGMARLFHRAGDAYVIVDVGSHTDHIRDEIPSGESGLKFVCTGKVTWSVSDPRTAAQFLDVNVSQMIAKEIVKRIRWISGGYRMSDTSALERRFDESDVIEEVNEKIPFVKIRACEIQVAADPDWERERRRRALERESRMTDRELHAEDAATRRLERAETSEILADERSREAEAYRQDMGRFARDDEEKREVARESRAAEREDRTFARNLAAASFGAQIELILGHVQSAAPLEREDALNDALRELDRPRRKLLRDYLAEHAPHLEIGSSRSTDPASGKAASDGGSGTPSRVGDPDSGEPNEISGDEKS